MGWKWMPHSYAMACWRWKYVHDWVVTRTGNVLALQHHGWKVVVVNHFEGIIVISNQYSKIIGTYMLLACPLTLSVLGNWNSSTIDYCLRDFKDIVKLNLLESYLFNDLENQSSIGQGWKAGMLIVFYVHGLTFIHGWSSVNVFKDP